MKINLQDSNFIISYIQMFLKEYSGINIKKVSISKSKGVYTNDSYIISMNNPIRVTGIYDIDTYRAAALYMAFNYPNEQFPSIWSYNKENNSWSDLPYEPDKLTVTMDKLIKACCDKTSGKVNEDILVEARIEGLSEDVLIYNEICANTEEIIYLTWSELLRYFSVEESSSKELYEFLSKKTAQYKNTTAPETGTFSRSDLNDILISIIINNSTIGASYREVTELNERVLSYFFGEVVSKLSTKDEIYRIQQMIYDKVPLSRIGKFDEQMTLDIKRYQQDFIKEVVRPDSYNNFKVTGYVDPWTERVIRERGVL